MSETPTCAYCDATTGLRIAGTDCNGRPDDFICADCFTGTDEGPSFDDLPLPSSPPMPAPKHTPGPWSARNGSKQVSAPASQGCLTVAKCSAGTSVSASGSFRISPEEAEANALLIASAPALLQAAKIALSWMYRLPIPTEGCTAKAKLLHDAIAAAEGEVGIECPLCLGLGGDEDSGPCHKCGGVGGDDQPSFRAQYLATVLPSDPYDERPGPYYTSFEAKKLEALRAGDRLFVYRAKAEGSQP